VPQDQRAVASATPIHRIGQPDEVAAAAVWLCPDAGRPRPGSTLVIDGGKLAAPPPFAPIAEAGDSPKQINGRATKGSTT
jgi:Enoyl-(Acyl carrier protein) reductase